ncbi:GAF domain-containing protein [Paracoccus tibetensis]|uniref:GAF domain-containing protein n=1 Tax=Paracoccus tibetensis TaxID=336292 RepID=UPI003CCBD7E7
MREGDEIEINSTFCRAVRQTSEMIIFSDAAAEAAYRDHPVAAAFGIVSYASVPIFRGDGSFFGTLLLQHLRRGCGNWKRSPCQTEPDSSPASCSHRCTGCTS